MLLMQSLPVGILKVSMMRDSTHCNHCGVHGHSCSDEVCTAVNNIIIMGADATGCVLVYAPPLSMIGLFRVQSLSLRPAFAQEFARSLMPTDPHVYNEQFGRLQRLNTGCGEKRSVLTHVHYIYTHMYIYSFICI